MHPAPSADLCGHEGRVSTGLGGRISGGCWVGANPFKATTVLGGLGETACGKCCQNVKPILKQVHGH